MEINFLYPLDHCKLTGGGKCILINASFQHDDVKEREKLKSNFTNGAMTE